MKILFTILLAGMQTLAVAQNVTSLSKSVDDDGEQLSIRVSGTIHGEKICYNRKFKVAGMSRQERDELAEEVIDSLLAEFQERSEAPEEPEVPEVAEASEAPETSEVPEVPEIPELPEIPHAVASMTHADMNGDKHMTLTTHTSAVRPYTKEVRFNEKTGELFLRYAFERDGEEFIFEKTADASGLTDLQRQKAIRSFEREIALPGQPEPIP